MGIECYYNSLGHLIECGYISFMPTASWFVCLLLSTSLGVCAGILIKIFMENEIILRRRKNA